MTKKQIKELTTKKKKKYSLESLCNMELWVYHSPSRKRWAASLLHAIMNATEESSKELVWLYYLQHHN